MNNEAMMMGSCCSSGIDDDDDDDAAISSTGPIIRIPRGNDITESPEWIDGEMVYPSIGMVFELAFLKCHLLYSLRSGRFRNDHCASSQLREPPFGAEEMSGKEALALAEKCVAVGEEELER